MSVFQKEALPRVWIVELQSMFRGTPVDVPGDSPSQTPSPHGVDL